MSIFDRLLAGELPASFVYRDERCAAFLDISPMARGHTLVIPTRACVTLDELDAGERAHLWSQAQHLLVNDGKAASQSVPHVHVHVIPRYGGDTVSTVGRMIWHVATLAVPRPETRKRRARLDALATQIAAHMPETVGP